jgi:hypothetical protein
MSELLTPGPVLRIGRKRTNHRPRVLIEGKRVVIRTACGLDPLGEGFVEESGFVTCDDCEHGKQVAS